MFTLYVNDRNFFRDFVVKALNKRRELIHNTLNNDKFFNQLMPYMSRDQQTQILLAVGQGGYAVKEVKPLVQYGDDDEEDDSNDKKKKIFFDD